MTKIKKSVFRLFRVQACKATNHNQTSHNFLSIFLCVHGKYFIRYARSELRVFHVNLFTLSVTVTFFSATCKFSHCRCQRRLVIYQTWQGFHSRNLTKFFAERLTITAIPKTGIIVVCVDAHCSEVTDLICSFVAPSSSITRANSTWFIMLHFKFLVSLLNVILKISPLQRSEQKGKNEINPKDITQYQNVLHISSCCHRV